MLKLKTTILFLIAATCLHGIADAQVYVEQQSRHRFAQTLVGLDLYRSQGGTTSFINTSGNIEQLALDASFAPRVIIGGTHFWGHADFYIAIPLSNPTMQKRGQEIANSPGVETGMKIYPWRIEKKKIRPYVGTSLFPYFYSQDNGRRGDTFGPDKSYVRLPLLAGLTYNTGRHLLELGLTYKYNNEISYHISASEKTTVKTPPLSFSFSYRYIFDTTLSAEKDWQSGKTQAITKRLANRGALNGFYAGAGLSSAWWLGKSSHNSTYHPFIPNYGTSLMPDVALGYYFHRPDLSISALYRGYSREIFTYGIQQNLQRKSAGIEFTKGLFDYHGFVPFVGPVITLEQLSFKERNNRQARRINTSDTRLGYGLTFGWDIRPNRLQWFILRTNLRYFPNLELDVQDNAGIRFSNIEFNFIQLLIFPNRLF